MLISIKISRNSAFFPAQISLKYYFSCSQILKCQQLLAFQHLWAGKLSWAWEKFYNIGDRPNSPSAMLTTQWPFYFQLWSANFKRICNFFQKLEYCPDCGFCIIKGTDNVNMYHYINANGANMNNSAIVDNMDGKIIWRLACLFFLSINC